MENNIHNFYNKEFAKRDRKLFKLEWYTRKFEVEKKKKKNSKNPKNKKEKKKSENKMTKTIIEDMTSEIKSYNALAIGIGDNKEVRVPYVDFVNCDCDDIEEICSFTNDYGHLLGNVNVKDKSRASNLKLEKLPFKVNQRMFKQESKKLRYIVELYSCLHTIVHKNSVYLGEHNKKESAFVLLTKFFEEENEKAKFVKFNRVDRMRIDQLRKTIEICNYSKEKIMMYFNQNDEELFSIINKHANLIYIIKKERFNDGKIIFEYHYDEIKNLILSILSGVCTTYINSLKIFFDPEMVQFDTVSYKGNLLSAMYFRFYLDVFMKQISRNESNIKETIPIRTCRNCGKIFVSYYRYDKHYCSPKCGHTHRERIRRKINNNS